MAMPQIEQEQPNPNRSQLTTQDVRRLVEICSAVVDLCATLTGRIDPAAAALLKTVVVELQRDDKPIYKQFNHFTP
jgi:hypothetical protein